MVTTAMAQVASISDLSNDKVYTFKSGRSSDSQAHYLLYHTDAPDNLSSTYGSGHPMDYSDATTNFHFAVYKYDGQYYLFNIAAKKFVGNNDNNDGAIPLVEMPTNGIEIRTSNNATYNFVLSTNGTGALNCAATYNCHGVVNWTGGYYNLEDGGNIYLITEVGDLDADLKATIEERLEVGVTLSEAQAIVAGASDTRVGAYKSESVADLATALANYNENQTSDNFNFVKNELAALSENDKVTLSAGEIFTIKCLDTNRGYMVYSTVEGKGSETQVYLAGTNRAEFHAKIDDAGIYKEWAFTTIDGKNYLYNIENKKFINADGVVQFTTNPVAFNFIDINNSLYEIQFESNNRYLSFSPGWGANCVRTEPGVDDGCKFYLDKTGADVDLETVATVEASFVNGWKDAYSSTFGYVGGYPNSAKDDFNAISTYEQVKNFENTYETLAVSTSAYYRLVCVAPKTGNGGDTNYNTLTFNGSANLVTAPASNSNFNQIFQFEDAGEGKFYLKNANADGYLNKIGAASYRSTIVTQANACKIQLLSYGNAQWEINNSEGAEYHSLFAENHPTEGVPYACAGWDDGANSASAWYIIPAEEIEVTVSNVEYATLYSPVALTVPAGGVTAHTIAVDGSWAVFGEALTTIPANTGVILNGAGTHTFAITTAPAFEGTNLLAGTTIDTEIAKEEGNSYYILAKDGEEIGFYNPVLGEDETKFNNAANKAYLVVPESVAPEVACYSFRFGEGTTGIENVTTENVNVTGIYDLTGRRVEAITAPGIYVVNGKKVLVK